MRRFTTASSCRATLSAPTGSRRPHVTDHPRHRAIRCAIPFALPARRRRIGAGGEDPPARLLTMLAIAFLLASPVITLLLVVP
ncbi:hypothetical protein [Dankookia sp. P2]|uniref:hypothetical protein n=1 Tax=Dankookia sp. P2 TaxID=3423955 RepID=UPI003D663FF4